MLGEGVFTRGDGEPGDTAVHINTTALADLSDAELEAALRVAERLSA